MKIPEKCPFCGSARQGVQEGVLILACGTRIFLRARPVPRARRTVQCCAKKTLSSPPVQL
jgi:hypothetical protein